MGSTRRTKPRPVNKCPTRLAPFLIRSRHRFRQSFRGGGSKYPSLVYMVEFPSITGRRLRRSSHIKRKPASNLHHAIRCAETIGYPLNQHVTINLSELGLAEGELQTLFEKVRDQTARWLARRTRPAPLKLTYVWVIENATSLHVHWLVHIPGHLQGAFRATLERWLQRKLSRALSARAIVIAEAHNVIGLSRYFLKGMDPHTARYYGVKSSDQGMVAGRRSGFSKNLGPTARKRRLENNPASYKPKPFFRWADMKRKKDG